MFYFNYVKLCNKKGISPTAAAMEMGFNRSMVTRWGGGSQPRLASLQRIAEYFNVPIEELTKEEKSPATQKGSGEDEVTDQLLSFLRSATPEEQQEIANYIEFIKSKRK